MYRNVSFKMDKIFSKYYYIDYFGLCKFSNIRYLFSNDTVFSGHPLVKVEIKLHTEFGRVWLKKKLGFFFWGGGVGGVVGWGVRLV